MATKRNIEKIYFLFGNEVCRAYSYEGLKAALRVAETEIFETYCWNEDNCSPVDLLYAFEGYDYYLVISKKEYDKFNSI